MDLAIIGAGLAGLATARSLREQRPDLQVVLFEQSEEIGGRATTRRETGAIFDDGAQYLKAATPAIERLVTQDLDHTTLVDIARPVWTFDGQGTIQPGDPAQNADPKWTYSDGLSRLAENLAAGLTIRRSTPVDHLVHDGNGWRLHAADGMLLTHATAVLLTPPAPATRALIARSTLPVERQTAVLVELDHVRFRPCISITLGYPTPPREQPFYALVNIDRQHPISWLAYEHLKPGRASSGQGVLIAQMAPGWSTEFWDLDEAASGAQVADLVAHLLDEAVGPPAWIDRRSWRYALPDSGCDADRLNGDDGLFFAGDYLEGQGRLHLAITSGWNIASRILASDSFSSD